MKIRVAIRTADLRPILSDIAPNMGAPRSRPIMYVIWIDDAQEAVSHTRSNDVGTVLSNSEWLKEYLEQEREVVLST